MRKLLNPVMHHLLRGGIATIVLGAVLLAFPFTAVAQWDEYEGPEFCKLCHEDNYNEWSVSGHPYKLMTAEDARNRPIPLPEKVDWDEITYVIGGYKWKSRYIDNEGYIYTPSSGNNHYNNLTGEWSDYHAGEVNKPYDCGRCHTTAWIADEDADTDNDLSDNQDGLPGMHGVFYAGGIQCEQCHGPGFDSMTIDRSAEACGECHIRGDANTIPASGGFIRHHEQYNEFLAGPHSFFDCVTCHDPHKKSEFSIVRECSQCHGSLAADYAKTPMADYGVECEDCHMPYASKSAQALGPHQGDLQTHIFYIDTDPDANMFTEDGLFVKLDDRGKAKVTMDFACKRCHLTASLDELALYAKDFHDKNKGLEDIGLDPGLTGTWWEEDRAGEGYLLNVGYFNGVQVLFGSFYTYDSLGGQVWLTLETASIDGIRVNVDIYMPEGAQWGDDFESGDVDRVPWGTGSFEFPTCTLANVVLTPNQAMKDLGFTDQSYPLTRTLDSGSPCPTFVNNEMRAAAGN
jgi:hypothetical protein